MPSYIAIIHKEPESDYGVSFPDFPGCITAGGTLDEAKDLAMEALTGHIRCLLEDGEEIPPPAPLETIMATPDFADGVAFLVSVSLPSSKTVRVNISVPADDLRQIDALAKKQGMSRSAFLIQAAKRELNPEAH
jgi:predicted RNase H-like HicB family nuclease